MDKGDVIVDGGNEWFQNSIRRSKELEPQGILYVGMGISGGEEGARIGPSLMPGGPREAYDLLEPIMSKCAAQTPDGPCICYLGAIGTGNCKYIVCSIMYFPLCFFLLGSNLYSPYCTIPLMIYLQ